MRQGHNSLLPVLRSKVPFLLRRDTHKIVVRVEIKVFDVTNLLIAEAGTENELQHVCFIFGRNLEHGRQLLRLIDRTDGIDVARPVALFQQLLAPMTLEELKHRHHLVVDGASSPVPARSSTS